MRNFPEFNKLILWHVTMSAHLVDIGWTFALIQLLLGDVEVQREKYDGETYGLLSVIGTSAHIQL